MLGGWSERMEERLLWLLRLGRGLAGGGPVGADAGVCLLWPWRASAGVGTGMGTETRAGSRMREGGSETGREHGCMGKF